MPKSLLPESWNVPQIFRDRLGEQAGRQRIMFHENHLLLVLHEVPSANAATRTGRFYWRDPEGAWRSQNGSHVSALHAHVDDYEQAVARLEKDEAAAKTADDYFGILNRVVPLRRAARHMYAVLQQAREAVPAERELIRARDEAGVVDRGTELLAEDAKNGLEYAMAKQAEAHASHANDLALSSHRLNRLAATFFPIVTVAGIFGMNLKHGFEWNEHPSLFWGIVGAGVFLGFVLNVAMMGTTKRGASGT